jgi:Do/DeqQ family serine protease
MMWRSLTLLLAVLLAPDPAAAGDPFLRRTVTVQVVEEAGPAVVNITTEQVSSRQKPFSPFGGDPFFDRFFRDFFEPRLSRKDQNLGSGVVIDAEGHILTADHVVSRASHIRVVLADGREFEATVVGADPNNDIAVLKIETEEQIPWLPMGSSEDLMVGEPVIAIGNPFGFSNTVTTGVISALNRSIRAERRTFHGFLQTDASINPGNSGGPLLNAEGELIGVNTAVYQSGQGIGFAIPIDVAARVVHELIEEGEITPVWLGIEFQNLTPRLRNAMDLPADMRGAVVNRVRKKSPARRAGVKRGDVVVRVDERPVRSARGFFEMLETAVDGQELGIELWRNGRMREIPVRAEEIPDGVVEALVTETLGMELELREGGGCLVRSVRDGSGAQRIGIQEGDLLLAINNAALEDAEALRRAALALRGRSRAQIVVQRGAGRYHVTIPLV